MDEKSRIVNNKMWLDYKYEYTLIYNSFMNNTSSYSSQIHYLLFLGLSSFCFRRLISKLVLSQPQALCSFFIFTKFLALILWDVSSFHEKKFNLVRRTANKVANWIATRSKERMCSKMAKANTILSCNGA